MKVLQGEKREKGTQNLSKEIMAEKFPNLMKTLGYISKSSINSNRVNTKRSTLRHLKKILKLKDKQKIQKTAREM